MRWGRLLGNLVGIGGTGLALLGVALAAVNQYGAALMAVLGGTSIAYLGHWLVMAGLEFEDDTPQGLFDDR